MSGAVGAAGGAAIDPATLTDSKSVLSSRRFWGLLMLVVPLGSKLAGTLFGVEVTAEQTAQVTGAVQHIQNAWPEIMEALGALQLAIGMWKAQQPLHLSTPYQVDDGGKKVEAVKPLTLTPDVAKTMDEHPPK